MNILYKIQSPSGQIITNQMTRKVPINLARRIFMTNFNRTPPPPAATAPPPGSRPRTSSSTLGPSSPQIEYPVSSTAPPSTSPAPFPAILLAAPPGTQPRHRGLSYHGRRARAHEAALLASLSAPQNPSLGPLQAPVVPRRPCRGLTGSGEPAAAAQPLALPCAHLWSPQHKMLRHGGSSMCWCSSPALQHIHTQSAAAGPFLSALSVLATSGRRRTVQAS